MKARRWRPDPRTHARVLGVLCANRGVPFTAAELAVELGESPTSVGLWASTLVRHGEAFADARRPRRYCSTRYGLDWSAR